MKNKKSIISRISFKNHIEELINSAEHGDVGAQYRVGMFYASKPGIINQLKASYWLKKAAKRRHMMARKNIPIVQYEIGIYYAYKRGLDNKIKALECLTEAANHYIEAKKEIPEIQYQIGLHYALEKGIAVKNAVEWLKKAADKGHVKARCELVKAYYKLGMCYVEGYGVKTDWKRAIEYFLKIKNKIDSIEINDERKSFVKNAILAERKDSETQYQLGMCFLKGKGVEQDGKEALKWFTKAAVQGHVRAQYNLGVCYAEGKGTVIDYKKAFRWFAKAAKQGCVEAQYQLGICYAEGEGVEKNSEKMIESFVKAADQDYADAYYQLGLCYALGKGVEADFEKAINYFVKIRKQLNSLKLSTNEKLFVRKVILGKRKDAKTMYQLGLNYLKAGQHSRAKVCLCRAAIYGVKEAKGLL